MASSTQGIQQLLAAEKKAADKVGDARKRKLFQINHVVNGKLKKQNSNEKSRLFEKIACVKFAINDHVRCFHCVKLVT